MAQLLAAPDQHMLDVLAKLAAHARLLGAGGARKTDATDAASVGAVAQRNEALRALLGPDTDTTDPPSITFELRRG